jgi:nucleoside-triphosphatase THEP1
MPIGFVCAVTHDRIDTAFRDLAETLAGRRWRLGGVLPEAERDPARHPCDRALVSLATGARLPISQNLGTGSTGCRLDAAGLEAGVADVAADLDRHGADLLIVNKFGKLEATGRGFCSLIVAALSAGVPVLVGVNALNRARFDAFADGMADQLSCQAAALAIWAEAARRRAAA